MSVRWNRMRILLAAGLLWLGFGPQPVLAGAGSFENGKFNFCVSVRFPATVAQIQQVKTAFQNGSQILADATDGQHRFGTIRITNNSGASNASEYWIYPVAGRATATPGLYGVRGQHVDMFFPSNFVALNGPDGDAYTIAHEHSHHAYGVFDEYKGSAGAAESAPPSAESPSLNYSLMDNYFTRGGRGTNPRGAYTLNEYDVASNFDPDRDTDQYEVLKKSVWETIAANTRFPALLPSGLPVSAPPVPQAVTFVDGIDGLRVVVLVDRSGSMSIEGRLDSAKLGAKQFVNLLNIGDGIGVASFETSSAVNFPLRTIVAATDKTAAKAAVDGIVLGGATNIGSGLLTALAQLTTQANRSCNEIIVLLSDGDHNTGTDPISVIPTLQREGVTVFTIGLGASLSTTGEATLQRIASSTGGRYFRAATSFDLAGIFNALAGETTGAGLLTRAPRTTAPNQTTEVPVAVEANTGKATFALSFAKPSDAFTLSLRTPSGGLITGPGTNVEVIDEGNSITYIVTSPAAGSWQMVVKAGAVLSNNQFETVAYAKHEGVQLTASVKQDVLTFPNPAIVQAKPQFAGQAVVNVAVKGSVRRPDGVKVPLTLFDDGQIAHGDARAGDGVYGARYNDYTADGTYSFDLTAENKTGTIQAGEALFSGSPSNAKPAPVFVRQATTTAVVTGVPSFVPTTMATVEFGPELINLASQNPYVTAYIEVPAGSNVRAIARSSLAITAVDGTAITPIKAVGSSAGVQDFDHDHNADIAVTFDRAKLRKVLRVGSRELRLEGLIAGRQLTGVRSVPVISQAVH